MARPKGFADWNPREETLAVIGAVRAVLDDYRDHLPLTVRQIFYRLVGAYGFPKTERDYNNLANYLVRARRAGMIPFSAIRDDGTESMGGGGYSGPEGFWRSVRYTAEHFRRDRLEPQVVAVELWCEAAGMVPQLERATRDYSIPVFSTGGFSSVTVTHEIAQRASYADKPTVFLHIGDYDPSGQSIFESMSEDAELFAEGLGAYEFEPERVALTAGQVEEFGLPTAPPKSSDTRSRSWFDETCQAEALPPDLLARLAREAVENHLDLDLFEETVAEEEQQRNDLIEKLDEIQKEE